MKRWFFSLLIRYLARYEGAQFSPSRSILHSPAQSARFDINSATRLKLVEKSRYFEKNSAILNRMADLFEQYVAGSGVPILPASSSEDWNKKAKIWIDEWEPYADLCSLQGFYTMIGLIARTWFVDGEVFIYLTKGFNSRGPRLQLIEGHRVMTPPQLEKEEGKSIVDGISIDQNGREIGVWVGTEVPGQRGKWTFELLSSDDVIHHFEPSRTGQYRGLPFCHPVINELHDLEDLHMLEMKAAKIAARIGIINKNKTGDMPNAEAMVRAAFSQGTKTHLNATASETREAYYDRVFGGEAISIKIGDEIQQLKGERPSVVTRDYMRYKTELVCTGIGMPYVIVFPDSMQGTVYRGALEMADAWFRARFGCLSATIKRIHRYNMIWAKANDPRLRDAPGDWYLANVHPPRAVNVDVGRNSTAMIQELAVGATNYERIYAPLGCDWKQEFDKLNEQKKYAAKIGLDLTGQAGKQQGQPADPSIPPAEEDEDEDKEKKGEVYE